MQFEEVIKGYFPYYDDYSISLVKSGNINKTFVLNISINNKKHKYILQKLNCAVFLDPIAVIENSTAVLDYFNDNVLFCLKTLTGEKYFKSSDNSIWRIYNFVSKSISFDETNSCDIIYQVGKAYGNFFYKLQNFDATKLKITIPNFHNTKMRYKMLEEVINSKTERTILVQREYALLKQLKNQACFLDCLIEDDKLPLRIAHNDTKCNNVLFNRLTHKYITVIDLDTIMPGFVAHDFGDGARSICSSEREDSRNFENISFDLNKFYHYAKGFSEEISGCLTELEKMTIHLGILKITTELSIRFLTDFLLGDVYFKTNYKNHNLDRAINQLTLAFDIFDKQDEISEISNSLFK